MLHRPRYVVALTILAGFGGCVAVASLPAPSRASARAVRACPLSRLAAAKSLKGVAGVLYVRTASGSTPATRGSKTVTLHRDLENVTLTLPRMRSNVPGVLIFGGRGRGGTLSVQDTVEYKSAGTSKTETGTLQGTAAPTLVHGTGVFLLTDCKAWFVLTYRGRGTYSGEPGLEPATTTVAGTAFSYPDETPSATTFSSIDPLPAVISGCSPSFVPPPTEGCYTFSGGWANDFATLAHCKSVVAESCAPNDKPIASALLRWNLRPSYK